MVFYYSTVVSFYHIRAREHAKYSCVLRNPGLTVFLFFFFLLKEDEAKTKCSGIINLLVGVLVDNTRGHFTHCSHFSKPRSGGENTMQLVKYPRVLSSKTPNKVYYWSNIRLLDQNIDEILTLVFLSYIYFSNLII